MAEPVIITAAIVGAELTRKETPYLPLTATEIGEAARLACEAGAAIIHLHVRDKKGKPTLDLKVLKQAIVEIRKRCDPVIQVSTGGAVGDPFSKRSAVLQAEPEMASLNMGTMNFGNEIFSNPIPFIRDLAAEMKKRKIRPEIEIYDLSHVELATQMISEGLIEQPAHFQFVLGIKGGLAATVQNLELLISRIPKGDSPTGSSWTVAAVGRHEFPMVEESIKRGGFVRVGLEDNIYLEKGVLAKGSHELVQKAVVLARQYGRTIASSAQARKILCLASG
ncbi:MAG: 3-keto-5-aminohexanoate cleavage protein [Deltaproteobacteria bacterium]|nr:3-keto-5-aminohexanoate cleavage protein [Deltaproteobacteria bacterium]